MAESNNVPDRHDSEQDKRLARIETELTRWQQTYRTLKAIWCVIGGLVAIAYGVAQFLKAIGWLPGGGE